MALSPAIGCAFGVLGRELLFGSWCSSFSLFIFQIRTGTSITQHLPSNYSAPSTREVHE